MIKPDFSKMTRQKLRAYILASSEDDDEIAALINRGNPHSPKFSFSQNKCRLKSNASTSYG